jgi:hypothetical protein
MGSSIRALFRFFPRTGRVFTGNRGSIVAGAVVAACLCSQPARSYGATPQAATPTISPAGGTYKSAQTVTLKCSTTGASLRYTTDGSTPTASSTLYTGPISVSSTKTVRAVAFANKYLASNAAVASYSMSVPAAAPVFSPASAGYHTVQTVTISDATAGASIYYTTDGTVPTSKSTLYKGPIAVGASETFEAIALASGGSSSPVAKAWYTIHLPTAAPVASPAAGTYQSIQTVTLTDATPNAVIYYTLDGSYPSPASAVYSRPIVATSNTTITAIAEAANYEGGPSMKAVYSIVAPAPTISPATGTLQNNATVTIADSLAGAALHYTTDGSVPTASSPLYTGPIAASARGSATVVIRAIATESGYLPSAAAAATYTVELPGGVLAEASVGATPTMSIPADFLGLSTDWHQPPLMMGEASTGVNHAYRTLLKNLTANSTAPMPIRITGDNSQLSGLQSDIEPLVELEQAVDVDYILGVDLWNGNVALAQAETTAWTSGIPNDRIHGFEIGNEPDVYPYNGARSSSYNFTQFLGQFQQWQKSVKETAGSGFKIMGTSMGSEDWLPNSRGALASGTLSPDIVSQHSYLGGQAQPSGQPWPADYLLQPVAANEFPTQFASYAASAHQAGHTFRMSEINSFYGGGVAGISNSFSSALWAIDLMFNYLANGTDGVNWHSGQWTNYELFEFGSHTSTGQTNFTLTKVTPLYYGLLVFSEMAGRNARVLPVATSTDANVVVHATLDDSSTVHVIVINKDEHASGDVQIGLPGYRTGTVRYLTAASYSATNGVTWAGQTFDGSPDGTVQGPFVSTTISASSGVFTLHDMPITSAALIDFTLQ